jgi:hypothetical protein
VGGKIALISEIASNIANGHPLLLQKSDLSMIVARALKIGKIADGGMPSTYETMH